MKIMISNITLSLLFTVNAFPQGDIQKTGDSTATLLEKRSNLKLSTRIHSLGFFNYSGRICTDNPAFDFTISYDRKYWGVMTFSAIDMIDHQSDNNFSMTLIYTRIKLGKRVTIVPYTGFVLENLGKEKGDRHILITSLKVNPRIHLDHTMMFPNVFGKHDHDWVNRMRMLCSVDNHLDFIFSVWHNNKVFDDAQYFSTALNGAYNRIKVSKRVILNTGITALVMAETSDEKNFPKKNGIVFTLGAIID